MGKEARSLDNLFMFRESKKSLNKTPRGSFFMYPYRSEKEIKFYPDAFSCIYEHEKEQRLSSVCPQLDNSWLNSRMIIKGQRHALQASIHPLTLRLSPISLVDEKKEKGG
jgi:hypothetical protein